jgi:hypothetical protein
VRAGRCGRVGATDMWPSTGEQLSSLILMLGLMDSLTLMWMLTMMEMMMMWARMMLAMVWAKMVKGMGVGLQGCGWWSDGAWRKGWTGSSVSWNLVRAPSSPRCMLISLAR